jgi:hypothetical protein
MELNPELTLHLLSCLDPWTDRRRRDALVTVVMMLSRDGDITVASYRGLAARTYRVDAKLLSDAYAACPRDLKLQLARSTAFIRAEPAVFKKLFLDLWRRETSPEAREELASTLHAFLQFNPARADEFRGPILELFRSPRRYVALSAIRMVGYLSDLPARDLERLESRITSAWFGNRMNALNALCEWVKRHREVSPGVVAFATSPEIRAIARRIHRTDPAKDARTCAYYLLKALREYDARGTAKKARRARR